MYFNKFEIETANTKAENIETLKEIIYTDRQPIFKLNFDCNGKQFIGKLNDTKFDIVPFIEGLTSFTPVMKGEVIGESKSKIVVRMRFHALVISFLVFITALILWSSKNVFQNGGLIVLLVFYILTIFMYLKESKKFKEKLSAYFK
ncbi:MAG: hypothetical protein H7282_04290 [Cytophagaceae bacterium]|nr:hypothetical protein [Cytophagaceae bacterium]